MSASIKYMQTLKNSKACNIFAGSCFNLYNSLIMNQRTLSKMFISLVCERSDWISFFNFSTFGIPHEKKKAKGGEDASYASENLLVVADGVGGWNDHGIDPKAYSNKICQLVSENVRIFESKCQQEVQMTESGLKSIIVQSVRENNEKGSSTLLVLYLDQGKNKNVLYSANIGDSAYLIARPKSIGDFELLSKSEEQCHSFNFPFQVGTGGDNPNLAVTIKHHVKQYDLVIAGTDGLWDNLEVDDILAEVNKLSKESKSLELNTHLLSQNISKKAEFFSKDRKYLSPFAKKARENKYKNFIGGKPDDITVIAAQISYRSYEDYPDDFDIKSEKSDKSDSTIDSNDSDYNGEKGL